MNNALRMKIWLMIHRKKTFDYELNKYSVHRFFFFFFCVVKEIFEEIFQLTFRC